MYISGILLKNSKGLAAPSKKFDIRNLCTRFSKIIKGNQICIIIKDFRNFGFFNKIPDKNQGF